MKQVESFFWGIIAALGALVVELLVFVIFSGSTDQTNNISFTQLFVLPQLIVLGACIEEIFKYIIISKRIEMLSLRRSYLINSYLVGLGFFSIELGIVLATGAVPATNILVEIAIIHLGTSGIIGYIVATKNPKKIMTFIKAVLFATFLHSTYNILILDRTFIINLAIFALLAFIIIFNLVNLARINNRLAQD
jgi:predicted DNA-binding transcriptional regulator